MRIVQLNPIKETPQDYEAIEKRIKELLKRTLYFPLLQEFEEPRKTLKNSEEDLIEAIRDGQLFFYRGAFRGKFDSFISSELRALGATWDRKTSSYKIQLGFLPPEVRGAIASTEWRFKEKIRRVDEKLAKILPEEISDRLRLTDLFDRTIWKTERQIQATIRGLVVSPTLTERERQKIAREWSNNARLKIKEWTADEIKKLRADMGKAVLAGNRHEFAVSAIQKSFGVSVNKARFLARQETSLLMTKLKETRYTSAGVHEYTWHNVAGSPKHPVRPRHKFLADESKRGKIYRWDDPPITSEPGDPVRRNNPGQDYNCRCFARPVVRFKK